MTWKPLPEGWCFTHNAPPPTRCRWCGGRMLVRRKILKLGLVVACPACDRMKDWPNAGR